MGGSFEVSACQEKIRFLMWICPFKEIGRSNIMLYNKTKRLMKINRKRSAIKKTLIFLTASLGILFFISLHSVSAQSGAGLRRPVSPEQPMWLVHIDTWNYADPQKIIDLIPEDIRPFVVMNISLSVSHNAETSQFQVAEYGYEIARSWLRVCAQNQMWAVVQHSSGGFAHFSDFDLSVYESFYQEFPNLIGFNYAEQFWGYDDANDPLSPAWDDRISHFANLLELSNRYGGYLVVSWCGNQWSPAINPIGMLKRNAGFAGAVKKYTANYILCEKYTQQSYISDMESLCLGAYLSGYSGQYGIRYDQTGWTDQNGEHENFILATGGAAHLEHIMLTGQTVIDAPELIWTQCFRELNAASTTEGYTGRRWGTFPQFENVSVDLFRKILDGTIRIPSRQEVIDRTKVVVINDRNSGSRDEVYSSPETLFEGLYRMDDDGNLNDNHSFFKKTGRYPSIPTVYQLADEPAASFQVQVKSSEYSTRWPTVAGKINEFNTLFPEEYTGDIYAGRHENGWVIYNPFKSGQTASGSIPFKYNTCEHVELTLSRYTSGVMKEYPGRVTFYLSNFDENNPARKSNTIKIYGSTSEPTFSLSDRADHPASVTEKSWADGVFTLTVQHNGPVDITVNCSGTATGRLTAYTEASVVTPQKPAPYMGPLQYEAECFDYKYINRNVTSGWDKNIRNYTGQGYMQLGTGSAVAIRDTVTVLRTGNYELTTRYSVAGGDVKTLDLYVNGTKVSTPTFTKTASISDWNSVGQIIRLNAGKNVIELKANAAGLYSLNIDNIVVSEGAKSGIYHFENDQASDQATTPAAELVTVMSGSAGVVAYPQGDESTNAFKAYSAGSTNRTGVATLDMFPVSAGNYTITWKEYVNDTGGKKGILLRGNSESCPYAEGMKQGYLFTVQNNEDNTLTLESYLAGENGLTGKAAYTSGFEVVAGKPTWFRATAIGNVFYFECSPDGIHWEGAASASFTDSTWLEGATQLVWGFGKDNFDWVMDDIGYSVSHISVSKVLLAGYRYELGRGPSAVQSVKVSGSSLTDGIHINAPEGFEVSLDETHGYQSSVTISRTNDLVAPQEVFVRMMAGHPIGLVSGNLTVRSTGVPDFLVSLDGEVVPQPFFKMYNFSGDAATTTPGTPPSQNTAIGLNNGATAGVVSYTDANGLTSNQLKPYSGGQRNLTGVIDLNLFSKTGTDYSITWKQCVGRGGTDYKTGMLMRGDVNKVGGASTGYVQGIMEGYLLLAYTAGGSSHSEFRIYKSTSALNSLNMLVNRSVNALVPAPGQPVWYRASVSGTSTVSLQIEYSTDSITWETGASATDASSTYTAGASQFVWGLGVGNVDFYIDNIVFNGLDENSAGLLDLIAVSSPALSGFSYERGEGPSAYQSFTVSAHSLTGEVELTIPAYFEMSLDFDGAYSSSLVLSPTDEGDIGETVIYVRLKPALEAGNYDGEIALSSSGTVSKYLSLSGHVEIPTGTDDLRKDPAAAVVSKEYYTLNGQRVSGRIQISGIYIVRTLMSDHTIVVSKEWISRFD